MMWWIDSDCIFKSLKVDRDTDQADTVKSLLHNIKPLKSISKDLDAVIF